MIASDRLKREGINARVIDLLTIKPFDEQLIKKASQETGGIVTVEDHNILGGIGGGNQRILERMSSNQGVKDRDSGSVWYLRRT